MSAMTSISILVRQRYALLIALIVWPLLSCAVAAAELPRLTGRVVDAAAMIDPATEAAIVAKLEAFERKTSIQIVVATIDSLGGEAIEPYANTLFRAWGLGQASENNGVLLLVAKNDRKMRIEVGYGLEGTLTDLHSKLIIENTMVPAFRAGDFAGGISGAVDNIIMVLEGNADELTPPNYQYVEHPESEFDAVFVIFIVIWGTLFFGGFAMAILPPIFGTKIGPNKYRWLGMDITVGGGSGSGSSSSSSGSSWSSGGSSSSSGGFSGGGGSSGGGGASGSW